MSDMDALLASMPTRLDHCNKHGPYESRNFLGKIWSKCQQCAKDDDERKQAADALAARKARLTAWESKISDAGIPERFQSRALDTFLADTEQKQKALDFAKDYAASFSDVIKTGRCALFVGKPGTGKTHLAVGIGLRIMGAEGRTVFFTTVMRAVRRVKGSWAKSSIETEAQAIAAMTSPDLLILDEVGVQFGSEFERNILFDILNERYERRRPSILLSNLKRDELVCFLGERLFDRMREDGGKTIVFDWESYRGAK